MWRLRTLMASFLYALVDLAVTPFAVVGFLSWTRGPSLRREAKELAAMQAKSQPSALRALAMRHNLRRRGRQPITTITSPDLGPNYDCNEEEDSCGTVCDDGCGEWGCGVVVTTQQLSEKVPICGDEIVVQNSCAIAGLRGFTALVVDVDLLLPAIPPSASGAHSTATAAAAIAASSKSSRHGISWSESRLTLRHAALPSAPSSLEDGLADPVATPALELSSLPPTSAAMSGAVSEIELATAVPAVSSTLEAEVHSVDGINTVAFVARDDEANVLQGKEPLSPVEGQVPLGDINNQQQAAAEPSSANQDRTFLAPFFGNDDDGDDDGDSADVVVSLEAHASSTGAISRGPTESVVPASDVQFLRKNVVGSFGYSWTLRVQCVSAGVLALADVFFVPSLILLLLTRYRLGPHNRKVWTLLISFIFFKS